MSEMPEITAPVNINLFASPVLQKMKQPARRMRIPGTNNSNPNASTT
jgi:hypothetical protein